MSRRIEIAVCCLASTLLFAQSTAAVEYDVFLLGGQSNMVGSGLASDLPPALQAPQSDVLLFAGGSLSPLAPAGSKHGPEITFGRTVADAFPERNFALIKYAVGGTNLHTDWDPATGPRYAAFRSTVASGLAALQSGGNETRIVGMLWTQGERDAKTNRTGAQYEADLVEFVADVRTRYGADLPFFLSRLSSGQTNIPAGQLAEIRAGQGDFASGDPHAWMIDTDPFALKSDALHFDSAGLQSLGQAFGESYAAAVPEPSTWTLVAAAACLFAPFARRRSRNVG